MLKVDFGSRSQSRVPNFYSTFVKKSTLSRVNPTSTQLHLGGQPLLPSPTLRYVLIPHSFSTATQLTFTYLYSPSEARLGDRDYTTVTLLFWTEYCKFECNNCEENEEVSIFYFIPAPNMKSKQIYQKEEILLREISSKKLNEKINNYSPLMWTVDCAFWSTDVAG